jgi:equilibrative nucleoside transporter 1/2/3
MGAAASGVIIGIIRIITKCSLPQTAEGLRASTQIYLAASACITAVCLVLYEQLMPRLDVIQHHREKLQSEWRMQDIPAN